MGWGAPDQVAPQLRPGRSSACTLLWTRGAKHVPRLRAPARPSS